MEILKKGGRRIEITLLLQFQPIELRVSRSSSHHLQLGRRSRKIPTLRSITLDRSLNHNSLGLILLAWPYLSNQQGERILNDLSNSITKENHSKITQRNAAWLLPKVLQAFSIRQEL